MTTLVEIVGQQIGRSMRQYVDIGFIILTEGFSSLGGYECRVCRNRVYKTATWFRKHLKNTSHWKTFFDH